MSCFFMVDVSRFVFVFVLVNVATSVFVVVVVLFGSDNAFVCVVFVVVITCVDVCNFYVNLFLFLL